MCRALGVDALDLISMLTKTYKLEKKDNLYDLIQSIDSYRAAAEPHHYQAPLYRGGYHERSGASGLRGSLSRHCTPMMDSFVNLASAICGRDFWTEGRTAEKLGLSGKTAAEIQEMVR